LTLDFYTGINTPQCVRMYVRTDAHMSIRAGCAYVVILKKFTHGIVDTQPVTHGIVDTQLVTLDLVDTQLCQQGLV